MIYRKNSLGATMRSAGRAAGFALAALALGACMQQRPAPEVGDPLPPPGPVSTGPAQPYPSVQPYPGAGAQDAVLRGAAYLAEGGNTQLPPGSRMIVRVYDAAVGDINRPISERVFTTSGQGLPWSYEMRVPLEAVRGLSQAAVAARIEGPDGRALYLNDRAVYLREGGSDDIPMIPAVAGYDAYSGTSTGATTVGYDYGQPTQRAQPRYGIPDYDGGYGAPSYDVPTYPGQSYDSPSLSAPPLNQPGVL